MIGGDQHFNIEVNGQTIPAYIGQTVAAALIAAGIKIFRYTQNGVPRGLYCGMGVCFECRVSIDDIPDQRSCMIPVQPGMQIHLDLEAGDPHGRN